MCCHSIFVVTTSCFNTPNGLLSCKVPSTATWFKCSELRKSRKRWQAILSGKLICWFHHFNCKCGLAAYIHFLFRIGKRISILHLVYYKPSMVICVISPHARMKLYVGSYFHRAFTALCYKVALHPCPLTFHENCSASNCKKILVY